MPPVRTQVSCPNCRAPVTATIEQVFDVGQDPSAKQRFLSGRFNLINCPNCGYQGQVATPLLYHDPDKELLMSYVPMELAMPQMEQERLIGRLMNEVISHLPQEKRKGYLLNPKPAFTLQGMVERVYEADGITKEMLDAQRAKVQLLQNLLTASDDVLPELVKQHDAEIDATLFQLLAASAEATAASGNQAGAQRMLELQGRLLELASYGQEVRQRQATIEDVAKELRGLGNQLTADKLLELVMKTDDEDRLAAYVTFARGGMDYAFFEALTRRIDKAPSPEKERLTKIRDRLLEMTQQVDQAARAQMAEASNLLRTLTEAPDLNQAIVDNIQRIDETFLNVLNLNLEAAQRAGRQDMVQKLSRVSEAIMALLQESAPPEVRLVNELLQMPSDEEAEAALKAQAGNITQELVDTMTYIAESLRQSGQENAAARLDRLRSVALGEVMKANWQK